MPSPHSIDRTWLQQLASVAGLNLPPERSARLRPRLEQLLAIVDLLPAAPAHSDSHDTADRLPSAARPSGRPAPSPAPSPATSSAEAVAAVMAERDHDGLFLVPRTGAP